MKKHLIAAAVAAAVAVPAMAQVTVSGRIDSSIGTASNSSDQSSTRASATGLLTTPQLVISGSEDLGGGMKANFNVTSGFNTDAATAFSLGSRGITVGVSSGFGSLDIGKTGGSALNSIQASGVTGDLGNLGTFNARPDNSISYTSPAMMGITFRVLHGLGGESEVDGVVQIKNTEISGVYSSGPLRVAVAQQITTDVSNAAISASTSIFGTASAAVAAGARTADEVKELGFQVNYSFGPATLNYRFVKQTVEEGDGIRDQSAYGAGVAYNMGSGLSVHADYRNFEDKEEAERSHVTMSLAVVKALSKRTNVYGAYASKDNEAANDNPGTESIFGIGVRHSF